MALGNSKRSVKRKFHFLDLTQKEDVNFFSEQSLKFDALIFLVGLAHKKGKGKELDEFRRVNKQTLENLLFALESQGKLPSKIIFASTISIYGEKINQDVYPEDSFKDPFSPYAITKLEAEEYLIENFKERSWILRFAPVYSPDFQLNINRRTKVGNFFYKIGDGTKFLSLCNLENIGLAVEGILENKIPASDYNISDNISYSYNHLLQMQNVKWIVWIPLILIKGLYKIGNMINNIFIKENATKLISNNIYPSDKIRSYIDFPFTLNDFSLTKNCHDE